MQRSQIYVLTLVVLLVAAPGAVGAATDHEITGHPGIDVSVADTDFVPGEQTAMRVVVLNDGTVTDGSVNNPQLEQQVTTARSMRVRVDDDDHDAPLTVDTNEQAIAQLPDGGSAPVEFRITVDSDAEPGTYELPVNVTYNYTKSVDPKTSEYTRATTNRSFDVNVTVEEAAQFRVAEVDSNARIGATGTVDVTLKNTGTAPANNASVALTSQNADLTFGQATSSTRYVGESWEPGERRTVSYRVTAARSASQQRYAFSATVNYEDEDSIPTESRPVTLGVTPAAEQSFTVVSTESDVAVDDDGPLTVTVRNDGPVDVRDATVTVNSGSSALVFGESASATRYVGRWSANETRTIQVEATATPDAEPRSYSLQASVGYEDGEGDAYESDPLQFGLRPAPEVDYEFTASNVSSSLRVGAEGQLSGTITNTGDGTAESLVVAFESETQNVSPLEREYSVGDLAPNESAQFSFDVEISEGAQPGPRQFTLRPTYRNDDDERRQAESFDVREQVDAKRDVFALETSNVTVERGTTALINVTVTNAGDEQFENVDAALYADDPITVEDGGEFVEELAPGESTTLTFEVSADGGAITKQYPVEMDFQYDDADGDTKLASDYPFAVGVTGQQGGGGLPLSVIGIGFVAVVAVVGGYLRYGR